MRIYCHLLVVSLILEAALAANATASTSVNSGGGGDSDNAKKPFETEKNKRQIEQFLGSPGASIDGSLGYDTDQLPQAYPLQLTHGIYNQPQRLPLYTRRPTGSSKSPLVPEDDVIEQERQLQSQQQQPLLSSYYNYVPGINYDDNDDATGQIDSRNLPVEPRTKVETAYPNSAPVQRVAAIAYTPGTVKQNQNNGAAAVAAAAAAAAAATGQSPYGNADEDEYLDAIRNAELVKSSQPSQTSKAPNYQSYVTGSQTAAIDHQNYDYSTKSPFSNNEYKRYTTRAHIPPTPSSPVPNLQPQNSQQQFAVRQPASHYAAQQTKHFVTAAGPTPDYSQTYDTKQDTIRVNLKKYQDPAAGGKTKYDPQRGQYHHEVNAKPSKKVENFRPSYRFETTPQVRLDSSSQQPIGQFQQHQHQHQQSQQQPLHYQSVQQISQSDPKSGQSQYSIVVPQQAQQVQQAYFSPESNNPFQSFYPHNEQLYGANYAQANLDSTAHLSTVAQQIDGSSSNIKSNASPEFRIQYLNHPSATPTPTPRARYASDSTPGQPLKYELYDPNGSVNVAKDAPKIKLISTVGPPQQPQLVHRPQFIDAGGYYKKIKIPTAAHVQYVPIRQQQQYHQLSAQSPQPPLSPQASQHYRQAAIGQGQSDILVPIQPTQNALFVAPNTGQAEPPVSAALSGEKSPQQQHLQQHTEQRRPPLPITSPKKPITQAEFQALVDAGYKVQAIPVPVPVPVSAEKYKQLQYQPAQRGIGQPVVHSVGGGGAVGGAGVPLHHQAQPHTRQAPTHYIRYHPKQESEEGILTSYLKPLIDYIGGPAH